MNKYFVTYEVAKLLKEKGFNENCLGYYWREKLYVTDNINGVSNSLKEYSLPDIVAPLLLQVTDWLENNYNIDISCSNANNLPNKWEYRITNIVLDQDNNLDYDSSYDGLFYETKKQALENAIMKALRLI